MNNIDLNNQVQNLLEQHKAIDINHISVKDLTPLFDDMFVCTATSTRHAKSLADYIIRHFKPQMPETPRIEGIESGDWILIDLNNVIVHIMLNETRKFYRIEQLWQISSIPDNKE